MKKILNLIIASSPQIAGIISFTIVLKVIGLERDNNYLPVYQGLISYYSLFFMAITYVQNRNNILGFKVIYVFIILLLFPNIFYNLNGWPIDKIFCYSLLILLTSIIGHITLLCCSKINYLRSQFIISASLPFIMVVNITHLYVISMAFVFFIFIFLKKNLQEFGKFQLTDVGVGGLKSFLIHTPFFLIPFFDVLLIKMLGDVVYNSYILASKYIIGIINFFFSRVQLNLIRNESIIKRELIAKFLLFILIVSTLIIFFINWPYRFYALLTLLVLSNNLCSILMRDSLLKGVNFFFVICGPIIFISYVLSLYLFEHQITINNDLFLYLNIVCLVFPVIFFQMKRIGFK